jgi:cobalt-zinc-cadmium efflux system membrane fusion protein
MTLVIIAATFFTARWMLLDNHLNDHHIDDEHSDFRRGPHNGRLLEQDNFSVEITIFETGIPPEFRVYPFYQDQAVDPSDVNLIIELGRTGNVVDRFEFSPEGDLLRGNGVVTEPHSFDVTITAQYQGDNYQWRYENYEGRTLIPATLADEAGIKTEIAGPAIITEKLKLTGRVSIDPNRVSQVRPRFPGIIKRVYVNYGDVVKAGTTLLTVESSESLQEYQINAPISGLVISRNAQAGEATATEPLFTLVDLSHVWVELDIFAMDISTVRPGQLVTIETLEGYSTEGSIEWLSPFSSDASQSIHARVSLDNPDGRLRPGQFVRAEVAIAEHAVPLAVKRSGVQGFRDFQVVYARFDEIYEVRMLEFGISDDDWMEVVEGLNTGTEYVTENSYLIKADIEKSGASHDH